MRVKMDRTVLPAAAIIGSAMYAASLTGCVSYTTTPGSQSVTANEGVNTFQARRAMRAALRAVIARHPASGPDGRYAINFPAGTSSETAQDILATLPQGAVAPYEGMGEVPIYHISRLSTSAGTAKVDVIYPLRDFQGEKLRGNVTVWLAGGITGWSVERLQQWTPSTMPVPRLWIPAPQAELDMQGDETQIQNDEAGQITEPEPAQQAGQEHEAVDEPTENPDWTEVEDE